MNGMVAVEGPLAEGTKYAIETQSLGRRYGSRWVVRGLDLRVPRGAIYGFLGLNGAGKSTTIRMLLGLIRPHAGAAHVVGLNTQRDEVAIKRRVGYVAEQPAFYDWMTVAQLCRFVATYRKDEWDWKRANELIDRFRVPVDVKVGQMSKGQRAKTALVLALAFDPDVLVLDEPTSGLDPVARREFIEGILAEFQESGKTVFMSSHLVNELAGLVDHIGILHEGRLLRSGRVEGFLDRIRRVRMHFDGEAPREFNWQGLLRYQAEGREAVAVLDAFEESICREQLAALGARGVECERLTLEDAFVEVVGAADRSGR
jgi:ABC-2 type transport system ATP-binding protein